MKRRRRKPSIPPRSATRGTRWHSSPVQRSLMVPLLLLSLFTVVVTALGGEKAYFTTPQMTPNISHRQNVCDRYDAFRNGTVGLKDALEGMRVNVLMANYPGAFFTYDDENGIHPDYPGLMAVILDELARRAKFTWRDSFGISTDPGDSNATWTEQLVWGVNAYDISADWWAQNLERMNLGIAFLKEWYDSSIILIAKEIPEEISDEINYWNWTNPYDGRVWITTILTVIVSGLVYQVLEYLGGDRRDRPFLEWFQHNQYLSAINFTQAYEYQPKTFSTRLFGVSMAVWALVMTATYTANLASLLVDRKPPPIVAQNIAEIAVFGQKLCTWEGTNSDTYVRDTYPTAIRIPKTSLKDLYDGLHNGDCHFVVDVVASWEKHKRIREYNPTCDSFWVGGDRKISDVVAGFASKADSGNYCTGLIRDVVNLHMQDMIEDDFIEQAWEREYKKTQDINCDTYRPEVYENADDINNSTNDRRRRLLRCAAPAEGQRNNNDPAIHYSHQQRNHHRRRRQRQRQLKASSKGAAGGAVVAASASGGGDDGEKLTLEQMMGTFVLHWALMGLAVVTAGLNAIFNKILTGSARKVYKDLGGGEFGGASGGGDGVSGGGGNAFNTSQTTQQTKPPSNTIVDDIDELDPSCHLDLGMNNKPTSQQSLRESNVELQKQVAAMRLSQNQMEKFQQEMLEEQRDLKQQIQSLVQVVVASSSQHQQGQNGINNNSSFTTANSWSQQQQQQQHTSPSISPSRSAASSNGIISPSTSICSIFRGDMPFLLEPE